LYFLSLLQLINRTTKMNNAISLILEIFICYFAQRWAKKRAGFKTATFQFA